MFSQRRWQFGGWLAIVAMLALGAGCRDSGQEGHTSGRPVGGYPPLTGTYPIRVVATTGMVADLVQHVGGKYVEVNALMKERQDPHLYKASTGDVEKLPGSNVIFYSGLHLEGKMTDIFERMAAQQHPTYAVAWSVAEDKILSVSDGAHDPHVWFDVSLWSQAMNTVTEALCELDPPHADEYRAHAVEYQAELASLDAYCHEQLATIPADRRVLVTAHDAFHYFGRAYNLQVKAIQGISTEDEAGVREINELVDFLVAHKIKAVFVESSVSDRNIRVVEGCAAKGHDVKVGGELFSDAMGAAGTPEGTYVGMVRHNVETIVRALK